MANQLQKRSTGSPTLSAPALTPAPGTSTFVLVYHRSPYDETVDALGQRQWVEQKRPNGIIPTLRNLFQEERGGTWISWREDAEAGDTPDERLSIGKDGQSFNLRRLPLTPEQISSLYHVTSKESFGPILHSFPGLFSLDISAGPTSRR